MSRKRSKLHEVSFWLNSAAVKEDNAHMALIGKEVVV
jgi:hypothetical protein